MDGHRAAKQEAFAGLEFLVWFVLDDGWGWSGGRLGGVPVLDSLLNADWGQAFVFAADCFTP